MKDCSYFLDIDISILGAAPERFDAYEEQIRKEYEMVPQKLFNSGRSKVLKSFLDREYIYYTDYFRNKYEEIARDNMVTALHKLTQ